jgi:RNA polymerase sigma-70 factor (ECF subfamily)
MDPGRKMLMATEATVSARPPSRAETALPTFREVFAEHARYVGRTMRYLGVAEADLEDACQEVFVVVHRRLPSLDPRSGLRAWVRQICIHVAQNHRRGMRRRREEPFSKPIDVAAPATQQGDAERSEQRRRLLALLAELDETQRAVFVLYEIEGLTMSEIAKALGCPLQTAYSRLHAARARVEDALRGSEVGP